MIEQGIVILVNSTLGITGGYFLQVPPNTPFPSWAWEIFKEMPLPALQSPDGFRRAMFRVKCYGNPNGDGADAMTLAYQITGVLNGYQGTLADPQSTKVSCCLQKGMLDRFDSTARNKMRQLDFEIEYSV